MTVLAQSFEQFQTQPYFVGEWLALSPLTVLQSHNAVYYDLEITIKKIQYKTILSLVNLLLKKGVVTWQRLCDST